MKDLHKHLSLFLCIVLCLSFFPFSAAFAEETDVVEEEPALRGDTVPGEQKENPVVEEIVANSENQSEDDSLTVEGEGSFDAAISETVVDSGTCGAQGDNLTWTLDDKGTLTISGTGAMQDYYWTGTTPPTRPWEDYWHSIRELVVNDGVTALGEHAFAKMFELQRVVFLFMITSKRKESSFFR